MSAVARPLGRLLAAALAAVLLAVPMGCQSAVPGTQTRTPAPSGRLTVTVRDEAGQPVAGLGVSVTQDRGQGLWGTTTRLTTDTNGRAEAASLLPGRYQVSLIDVLPLVITTTEVGSGQATLALTRPHPPAS
jgi:hypothetical protein